MGVINDGDLMFSCECKEPKGTVIRNVYKVNFTPENLEEIYIKARQFRTLMGYEVLTKDQFYGFFVKPKSEGATQYDSKGLCARVDDYVGLFWLSDINMNFPPYEASVHYSFFDRSTEGRIELCRTALKYIFETYGFNRLWTKVPVYTKYTLQFVEDVGFRREGRMISNVLYKGKLFDTNLYAILKDESQDQEFWDRADLIRNERLKYGTGRIGTRLSSRDRQSFESSKSAEI